MDEFTKNDDSNYSLTAVGLVGVLITVTTKGMQYIRTTSTSLIIRVVSAHLNWTVGDKENTYYGTPTQNYKDASRDCW